MRDNNLEFIFITRLIFLLFLFNQPVLHATEQNKIQSSDSNLINFSYPTHLCGKKPVKPQQPGKRVSFDSIDDYNIAIADYNLHVASYNTTIKSYKSCINLYIKNGNHDINVIRKNLNQALKEARTKLK